MQETLEKCLLCGGAEFILRIERFGYKIVQCRGCKLYFVNPRIAQEEAKDLYVQDYFNARQSACMQNDGIGKIKAFKQKSFSAYLADFSQNSDTGKLLDVGCGEGYFLEVAAKNGWEPYGVEISEFAANLARECSGGEIYNGLLRDAKFQDNSFDVVTMVDVVEHFHDPVSEMSEVFRILKPGGTCYLLTPDVGSLAFKIMRGRWFELKPPEHLFYFSQSTLSLLLENAGFENIRTKTRGKILTLDYIASILSFTNPALSKTMKFSLGWLPFYRTDIHFPSGYAVGIGRKRQ